MNRIGLHEPLFNKKEIQYLTKCVNSNWVSTSGIFLNNFQKEIKKITKAKYVLPVLNATIGLHISIILAKIKKNDEVIVPTITFIATINSIIYEGCYPIFMDVDEHLNIDESKTIEFIVKETKFLNGSSYNKKTGRRVKAVIVVHTFGNAAKFEKLYIICKTRGIKIIEDAAASLGTVYHTGKFKNRHTGTIGHIGVISFNGNKIITSGNGGVVLLDNKKDYLKGDYLITQSKDDKIKFIHKSVGYNYKLSNLCAALGLAQLKKLNIYLKKKKNIRNYYRKKFAKIKEVELKENPSHSYNNNWLNIIRINKKKIRLDKLISKLKLKNIDARPIWYPNHLQKPFKKFQTYKVNNYKKYIKNLLCIPSSPGLKKKQIDNIVYSMARIINN